MRYVRIRSFFLIFARTLEVSARVASIGTFLHAEGVWQRPCCHYRQM